MTTRPAAPAHADEVSAAEAIIATGVRPRIGIVLGSGLSALADDLADRNSISYAALGGFPRPSVEGHAGQVSTGYLEDLPVAIMQGRAHYYESGRADAMRVPIGALQRAGCEFVLLTCAAGSVHAEMPTGSLMMLEDHIALGARNPLVGDPQGPYFVDMSNAYDDVLRERLAGCAKRGGVPLHSGVYAWFSGPSFETPAEIRAARILGADAVGMSTAPETILARACGLRVLAVAVITNLAAGMDSQGLTHAETLSAANSALGKLRHLIACLCVDLAQPGDQS